MSVKIPRLGPLENVVILAFGDGAWASLPDGVSSCSGKLVLAVGRNGASVPLAWGANKTNRIVRSPLAAEAMAMMDTIDEGFFCRALMEEILGIGDNSIALAAVTDSKSLEEVVKSTGQLKDKRCKVDVAAIREGVETEEFFVVWQTGVDQLADAFTKQGASKESLRNVIESGYCGISFNRED